MNRPRKKNRDLPQRMYYKHGAFYYVHQNKWTRLSSDRDEAVQEWLRITSQKHGYMPDLIEQMKPFVLKGTDAPLSESTKNQYALALDRLSEALEYFRPDEVTHGTVVTLLDDYDDQPAVANRLLVVLRRVFDCALERELVSVNPCHRVKRRKQRTRDRLITLKEYTAIQERASDKLSVIMDLCVLTGQRIGDVLDMKPTDITDEGISIQQEKTGKKLVIGWTDELRDAINRARALQPIVKYPLLFTSRDGKPLAHQNVWRDFKKAAAKAGVQDVTLHDLRALAATITRREGGDATALLGHSDARTTRTYLRDKEAVVVIGPRFKRA